MCPHSQSAPPKLLRLARQRRTSRPLHPKPVQQARASHFSAAQAGFFSSCCCATAAPKDAPLIWTLVYGQHRDRSPTQIRASRDGAAMLAGCVGKLGRGGEVNFLLTTPESEARWRSTFAKCCAHSKCAGRAPKWLNRQKSQLNYADTGRRKCSHGAMAYRWPNARPAYYVGGCDTVFEPGGRLHL
jgi:hypothetical protein